MILILAQLFVLSQQFDFNYTDNYDNNSIFIQSGSMGITIFKGASSFQIYAMQNKSYVVYNSSLESEFHLSYDETFKINDKAPKAIESKGIIVLPSFLKMFLTSHEPCLPVVEPIEICFDFTTERNILKVIAAVLGFMVLVTNFKDAQKAYRSISQNAPNITMSKSTFSDKFISWRRLPTVPENYDITPSSINTTTV